MPTEHILTSLAPFAKLAEGVYATPTPRPTGDCCFLREDDFDFEPLPFPDSGYLGLIHTDSPARTKRCDGISRLRLERMARELGYLESADSGALRSHLATIKNMERRGYTFETAEASFKLLLAKLLGLKRNFFEIEWYRMISERDGATVICEASLKLRINGRIYHTVAEWSHPLGALTKALRIALEPIYPQLGAVSLLDHEVTTPEDLADNVKVTRVMVRSGDGRSIWSTLGVSENIIEATLEAVRDALEYKLMNA